MARENGPILIKPVGEETNLFSKITIGAGETGFSEAFRLIDLSDFSAEYKIACTGTPNVKLQLQQSAVGGDNDDDWYTPDNFADLNLSITDKNLHGIKLAPIVVEFLRFKAIELTTSIADTVVTVKLSVQKRYSV